MINAINLNVEVKDEFNGRYKYLIEVFTDNPISNAGVTPIAAGTANKNKSYNTEISISKATTRLFIRQTDPKQRKEVYEYTIPENGGTMNCKLFYISTGTRAASGVTSSSNSAFEGKNRMSRLITWVELILDIIPTIIIYFLFQSKRRISQKSFLIYFLSRVQPIK